MRTTSCGIRSTCTRCITFRTSFFHSLTVEQLSDILENDKLNIKEEKTAFQAVFLWIRHEPSVRKQQIVNLLPKHVYLTHHVRSELRRRPVPYGKSPWPIGSQKPSAGLHRKKKTLPACKQPVSSKKKDHPAPYHPTDLRRSRVDSPPQHSSLSLQSRCQDPSPGKSTYVRPQHGRRVYNTAPPVLGAPAFSSPANMDLNLLPRGTLATALPAPNAGTPFFPPAAAISPHQILAGNDINLVKILLCSDNCKLPFVLHLLDDFLVIDYPNSQPERSITILKETFKILGIRLSDKKNSGSFKHFRVPWN
ncbi:kelch-like protein 10 isoform X2 [Tachysurus ichikawai]